MVAANCPVPAWERTGAEGRTGPPRSGGNPPERAASPRPVVENRDSVTALGIEKGVSASDARRLGDRNGGRPACRGVACGLFEALRRRPQGMAGTSMREKRESRCHSLRGRSPSSPAAGGAWAAPIARRWRTRARWSLPPTSGTLPRRWLLPPPPGGRVTGIALDVADMASCEDHGQGTPSPSSAASTC